MIVWLASYPRSGNTLTRAIFNHYFNLGSYSVYGDRSDIGANSELSALVGHQVGDLETLDLERLRKLRAPVLIKTHDTPSDLMSPNDIVVTVTRDGRDSVLSYYHYLREVIGTNEVTLADVIAGNVAYGTWGNHTLRWGEFGDGRTLNAKFETIVSGVDAFADELSELIKIPRSREPFPDFAKFKNAAPKFVRKGEVGGWRSEFTAFDEKLFDLYNGPAMRAAGYAEPALSDPEREAYAWFCSNLTRERQEPVASASESRASLASPSPETKPGLRGLARRLLNKV
jgi:hypothetical protein